MWWRKRNSRKPGTPSTKFQLQARNPPALDNEVGTVSEIPIEPIIEKFDASEEDKKDEEYNSVLSTDEAFLESLNEILKEVCSKEFGKFNEELGKLNKELGQFNKERLNDSNVDNIEEAKRWAIKQKQSCVKNQEGNKGNLNP